MIHGLPERLKDLRQKRGITQNDVAKCLCVSPSIVSSYETGERTPSVEILMSLATFYRCSTDYLLGIERSSNGIFLDLEGLSPKQVHLLSDLILEFRNSK